MAFSLFPVGQASIIGLKRTSSKPPPIAYIITEITIPAYALGKSSGKIVSSISPAAEQPCAISAEAR